ncbi:hypothetical protein PIB30_057141 [Stylosanthes scabra]|uniref:Aminotransferase-like plant mobile domain-containing protein n=1 Tax=Stylosanthes scabra TaxID=79078 RepID=A0ABU6UK13_9FABA|nr:hypothetical protein [Stylosanthes scabra]
MRWLRERLQQMPDDVDDLTSRQDFDECAALLWGSAMLAWTYRSLCNAARRARTNVVGCTPLLISWIYHKFLRFCPRTVGLTAWPLASRLIGY